MVVSEVHRLSGLEDLRHGETYRSVRNTGNFIGKVGYKCLPIFTMLVPIYLNMSSNSKIRKAYTREYKLEVIRHFHKVERNAYATAKKFNIARATIKDWVKKEMKIQVSH
jgi:hypothetical protein